MKKNFKRPPAGISGERANRVIDYLLQQLESGIKDPASATGDHWYALFGKKDSMVTHAQKLIAAMSRLAEFDAAESATLIEHQEEVPLSEAEVKLITDWLADGGR